MKFLTALLFLNISSMSYGISEQDTPINFWCRAEPIPLNGNYYVRTAISLEQAKNSARTRCQESNKKCQIMECGQGTSPFAYTCVAGKWDEDKIGGFFAFGKDPSIVSKAAYDKCWSWDWRWDRKFSCKVVCFPSDIEDQN